MSDQILLECPEYQFCFDANEWLRQYGVTNELFNFVTGKNNPFPKNLSDQEAYTYLLDEGARMDCPECGEVQCVEDLCEI